MNTSFKEEFKMKISDWNICGEVTDSKYEIIKFLMHLKFAISTY